MSKFNILIVLTLLVAIQTKIISEDQHTQASGFACCPDTYVFDTTTLSCVCPTTLPFVDASGRCITCTNGAYFDESSKQCATCPTNTIYNPTNKTCNCPANLNYVNS